MSFVTVFEERNSVGVKSTLRKFDVHDSFLKWCVVILKKVDFVLNVRLGMSG